MRSLTCVSLVLFLLVSGCQSVRPRHLVPSNGSVRFDTTLPSATCHLPTFFSPPDFRKALFKATLDVRNHHLTGLLFIKMIPDTGSSSVVPLAVTNISTGSGVETDPGPSHRMVFSNEFGMTYFDVEVGPDRFRMNYCFEPMDIRVLLQVLETDFSLLLYTGRSGHVATYVQKGSGYRVCRYKQGGLTRWDLWSPSGDSLVEVKGSSNPVDKTHMEFSGYDNGFPSRIIILNPVIKLKLALSLLSLN